MFTLLYKVKKEKVENCFSFLCILLTLSYSSLHPSLHSLFLCHFILTVWCCFPLIHLSVHLYFGFHLITSALPCAVFENFLLVYLVSESHKELHGALTPSRMLLWLIDDPAVPSTCSWMPQSQRKTLVFHFVLFFYSTYVFIGPSGTMQAGPTYSVSAKCPALQSLLCFLCGLRFCPFHFPFIFTPLTCSSSAVMMWQCSVAK